MISSRLADPGRLQNEEIDGFQARLLFTFWAGLNPLTANRERSLRILIRNCGIELKFIELGELRNWEIPSKPFHPGLKFLSPNHRSDYLRGYFMYHYGGAYVDLKPIKLRFGRFFRKLAQSRAEFCGSPEWFEDAVAGDSVMKSAYSEFASNGIFIFKKMTPFAREWLTRSERLLDYKYDSLVICHEKQFGRAELPLESSPHFDFLKTPPDYPLRWAELMGEIFHQLQWERKSSFILSLPPLYRIQKGNYR